ncbi:MAG: bifunctional 5,10-methylenetetrahydrofolate dehydrogenase/5,10-methenyltetrahydrofolate cyclohydrolase [Phycisphaeraceae bacterium]|nr:MAG: bifunctional 5,10-methylenetetrahydrofolate dehydrogenase/5,10-methenyltetrahydrofolate cyclohydrolase [Phycisphaeraceae bacterium]
MRALYSSRMTPQDANSGAGAGARLIDGKALAAKLRRETADRVAKLTERGRPVRLDALLAADPDGPAAVYAENQGAACAKLGIEYHLHRLSPTSEYRDIAGRVLLMSRDEDVSAIMVHLPLPDGVDSYSVQCLITPEKDVEGVNPANIGNIVYGRSSLAPCTALAVLAMIESTGVELQGRRCVIVGASDIVGKPIAVLLMRHEATVISCNKHTENLPALTREADVLVAAAGVPGLITADMVKPGAVVVDVGTSRVAQPDGSRRTVGDVDFDQVRKIAGWLSPVPGGVGPMTVAMLLRNVVDAVER